MGAAQGTAGREDRWWSWGLGLCASATGLLLLLIFAFVVWEAWPGLVSVGLGRFVGDEAWRPTGGEFGLGPMVLGSLWVTLGAGVLATPLGVGTAVLCRFYAPGWVAAGLRRALGVLAGVPSVVFGLWGLTVLVPLLAKVSPPGASVLAGSLLLGVMILPMVAFFADGALGQVSGEQMEAAAALGVGRWGRVWGVALPQARAGIGAGVLLALGRAVGETMAALMVCGNVVQVPSGWMEPVRVLTANIALEMAYATGAHRAGLFVSGLALLLVSVGLVAAARGVGRVWR